MNNSRTPQECISTVIHQINDWIGKGLCQNCAIKVVAALGDMTETSVETVWVDHQVTLLNAETALD